MEQHEAFNRVYDATRDALLRWLIPRVRSAADALLPTLLAAEDGTEPENRLTLTLEGGKELPAWIAPVARPVDDAFIRSFNERYDLHRSYDEKTAAAWREESLAHCKARGVKSCTVNLDGVKLEVINPGTVDILGMHNIQILLTTPDDWNEEQKNVFVRNLLFGVRIDDDLAIDCGGGLRDNGDGSYTMFIDLSGSIPFDRIATMQRVTLTPAPFATSYAESAIVLRVY